ncbi:TonB-dependent receptor [Sinimarinibacterium thermocellulolyticum]|uniref:TonB-dependent receptor n=1 Tax=Sinimarinibacterium thermocellulolyticum TaxID=3170016 RepID=A0ABV2A7H4_9GAMM
MSRHVVAGVVAAVFPVLALGEAAAPTELAPLTVEGASQVELSEVYAGGQVARGARAGLLGNLDDLFSPFSAQAYTAELIHQQQADGIGDVLQNDPTVRLAKGFGNFQELYVIRGFPVFSDDLTLNGVYGILPRQFVAAELMERVEVFRGANTFINGAAPGASAIGGTVNLVPKRAPEEGVRRFTAGIEGSQLGYGQFDWGERLGSDRRWGLRVNTVVRDGETTVEDETRALRVAALGTDYAGEHLRVSADLGFQDHRLDQPRPQVRPTAAAPPPPAADANFAQPWTYADDRQLFGVLRGELDLNQSLSAWLGFGGRQGEEANVLANPTSDAEGNLRAVRFDNAREDNILSLDAGVRSVLASGSVRHLAALSYSHVRQRSRNAFAFSDFGGFDAGTLAAPTAVEPPPADAFIGGDLDDPRQTEDADLASVALADTVVWWDGRLRTTFGLRHQTIETRSFDANTGAQTARYRDDAWTPAAGLVFRATPQLSVYANYAESLQPGQTAPASFNDQPVENAGESLAPYKSRQIELGTKYQSVDTGFTASVFRIGRPFGIVENQRFTDGGEQRNTGIELTVYGQPLPTLRLLGGLTWLDAELVRTQDGIDQGNQAIGVPRWQANVNVEWDVIALAGLTLEGRIIHTDEQFIDTANTRRIDAWTRWDAGLRYRWALADARELTLRARVENLTDEDYWASSGGFPGSNYLILGAARTLIASASLGF